MKKIIKNIFLLSLLAASFASCKKDENRVQYESATKPVLTASSLAPLVLTKATASQHAVTLYWTNPEYQFNTGVSSQDVTYSIQFDKVGKNFSTAENKGDIVISKDLGIDLNDSLLNRALGSVGPQGLAVNVAQDVEIRIKAVLKNDNLAVYSDPIQINITPYLDVKVPVPPPDPMGNPGNLYLVGSASPGGWANPIPAANLDEQTFALADPLDPTIYELTVQLAGGQFYLLLPENGSWTNKYAVHDKTLADLWKGGDFGFNGSNSFFNDDIPGPPDAGIYKLTFNFRTGKFTAVKQ